MPRRKLSIYRPRDMFGDDVFDRFFLTPFMDEDLQAMPSMEMYEDKENVVVKLEVPGFKTDELDVSVEDNVLTVSGSTEEIKEEDEKDKKYYYKGISKQSFTRSVNLPVSVDPEACDAEMKDGLLEIKLPKKAQSKASKISVR